MTKVDTLCEQIEGREFAEKLSDAENLRIFLIRAWKEPSVDLLFDMTGKSEYMDQLIERVKLILGAWSDDKKVALITYLYLIELRNVQLGKQLTTDALVVLRPVSQDIFGSFYKRIFKLDP